MRAAFVSSILRYWSWAISGAIFGLLQGAFPQPIQLDDVIQIGKEGAKPTVRRLSWGTTAAPALPVTSRGSSISIRARVRRIGRAPGL